MLQLPPGLPSALASPPSPISTHTTYAPKRPRVIVASSARFAGSDPAQTTIAATRALVKRPAVARCAILRPRGRRAMRIRRVLVALASIAAACSGGDSGGSSLDDGAPDLAP